MTQDQKKVLLATAVFVAFKTLLVGSILNANRIVRKGHS